MSIDPVTSIRPATAVASRATLPRDGAGLPSVRQISRSNSETTPVRENHSGKLTSEPPEMPRDEVQVQRTNDGSGDIVIRYMDPHGNLILQIPSSQVLALARAIERTFEQEASQESTGNLASRSGGTSDGH